jgi:hypothetical protein
MAKAKLAVTLDEKILSEVDRLVSMRVLPSIALHYRKQKKPLHRHIYR